MISEKVISNGTTYQSIKFTVKGNVWSLMKATGKHNYISVTKISNNPFRTLGKEFKSVEEACKHYKSPAMRVAIIQANSQL